MANIKSFLTLQDNMSNTLSKVQKNALQGITTFNKMSKEVDVLKKSLEEAEKVNPDIINTDMYHQASEALEQMENSLGDVANGENQLKPTNDNLNMSMTEINQTLEVARKAWNLLTGAIQEANKWMEISNNQFNAEYTSAVKMHGVLGATEEEISSMYEYASALQKVGVVGDEATLSGMSTLTMYADNIDQIKKLTPAILDLAVAENGLNTSQANIESTAQRVGYALNGNATMLKRMIGATDNEIKTLNNMNGKTKKAEYLFKLLESRVGGANETLAKTAQGGIMKANNSLGDLQERLGTQVVPYFTAFRQLLVDILTPIVNFAEANSDWLIPSVLTLTAGIGGLIIAFTLYKLAATDIIAKNLALLASFAPFLVLFDGFIVILNLVAKALSDWSGESVSAVGLVMGAFNVLWTGVTNIGVHIINVFEEVGDKVASIFAGLTNIILGFVKMGAWIGDKFTGGDSVATIQGWQDNVENWAKGLDENDLNLKRKSYSEAFDKGYNFGDNLFKDINVSGASTFDLSKIMNDLDGITGTDTTGGKALKVTSNDNLLSDEDIQMLLDIATRDYQLNYQQMTPNISVNFGDVRETVDVDSVLDTVGTRIEELIYGDAEVVY